jgi:hypothetical protein
MDLMKRMPGEALRISPKYSSKHWSALSEANEQDWSEAIMIVRDRRSGRFLRFADECLNDPYSGFVVLALDCLLAETIEQYKNGDTNGTRKSRQYIMQFLSSARFQPYFDKDARKHFYEDIRCGLLHQAEAKEMWLVRRGSSAMLQQVGGGRGYIIDVKQFHGAVRGTLEDYFEQLLETSEYELRTNLWKKMDHICRIREARGLLYESENGGSEQVTST